MAIPPQIELARQLASRLERLSADSTWAHRASGVRGSLLRWLDDHAQCILPQRLAICSSSNLLVTRAFEILTLAAREIRETEYERKSHPGFLPRKCQLLLRLRAAE